MADVQLTSVLTCPRGCGQYFYKCTNCHELFKPKPGDCCVFCSFGTVKCPPMQQEGRCC